MKLICFFLKDSVNSVHVPRNFLVRGMSYSNSEGFRITLPEDTKLNCFEIFDQKQFSNLWDTTSREALLCSRPKKASCKTLPEIKSSTFLDSHWSFEIFPHDLSLHWCCSFLQTAISILSIHFYFLARNLMIKIHRNW